jgi:hypothetical protein
MSRGEICPSATLSTRNPTSTGLAVRSLSYGIATGNQLFCPIVLRYSSAPPAGNPKVHSRLPKGLLFPNMLIFMVRCC